ncbi:hypothetical protein BpHYR1_028602 [Brachionus plicatilis]|uniref:Uncharacterized protein n=1 Tax=Brachionus plicatilis TaxID=10195 RepID=A0A3M7QRI4_BRAPC|nr:hypothetical protein BpHYR1_028602 [Brachionus plicatilis]
MSFNPTSEPTYNNVVLSKNDRNGLGYEEEEQEKRSEGYRIHIFQIIEKTKKWQSRKAALEELCELDPSRIRFSMEIHMMPQVEYVEYPTILSFWSINTITPLMIEG